MRWPRLRLHTVRALQLFQLARQGSVILVSLLLARSMLSTADIGHFEKLLYIGYAASFFWVAGLGQGFLSLAPRAEGTARPGQRVTAYFVFLLLSGLAVFSLLVGGERLLAWLAGQPFLPHFGLFLIYLFFFLPTFLLEHFLVLDDRPRALAGLGLASAALYLGGVLVPLWTGLGLRGSIQGLVVFAVLRHLLLLAYLVRHGRWTWQGAFIRKWFVVSAPLLAYALLGGFHLVFDNWLVGFLYQGDPLPFAHYRFGARELPLVIALAGALGTAMLPTLSSDLALGLTQLRRRALELYHLVFPLSIALMLSSPWWFPWIFTEAFRPSVPVFNVFLLIVASRLVFTRPILMALQDNRVLVYISVIDLLTNVASSFYLGARFGLLGIALGTLLAFTLEKALLVLRLRRRHGVSMMAYTPWRWWLAYVSALIGAFLLSMPFW